MAGPTKLEELYRQKLPTSHQLYERAQAVLPSGVTHDLRFLRPFPPYIDHAEGSRKWDPDGNEYVDYWMGHGALLLGHCHPEVTEAVQRQLATGTHYGACHALEVEWAEQVKKMVPSAEMVKFTSSGTEATQLVMRLARLFTGRRKLLKFEGHFHGWQDNTVIAVQPPYGERNMPGIPRSVTDQVVVAPPNDIDFVEMTLSSSDDIACIILEPTGGAFGRIPTKPGFLADLRDVTSRHDVLLVFDEVVTGFRCAPGGAQEFYNVIPDLNTLGKILAGGLPGAAVAGRADVVSHLTFRDNPRDQLRWKIPHQGTFNANPVSATAGLTALRRVESHDEIGSANAIAQKLRARLREVVESQGVSWCVYGDFSSFKILTQPHCPKRGSCDFSFCDYDHVKLRTLGSPEMAANFRYGMILNGVDLPGLYGLTSSVHTEEDVEITAAALDETISLLKEDGLV